MVPILYNTAALCAVVQVVDWRPKNLTTAGFVEFGENANIPSDLIITLYFYACTILLISVSGFSKIYVW